MIRWLRQCLCWHDTIRTYTTPRAVRLLCVKCGHVSAGWTEIGKPLANV